MFTCKSFARLVTLGHRGWLPDAPMGGAAFKASQPVGEASPATAEEAPKKTKTKNPGENASSSANARVGAPIPPKKDKWGPGDEGARLDYVMGKDRDAVRRKDTDAVSEKVAKRVNELANRIEEKLQLKLPTRPGAKSRSFTTPKTPDSPGQEKHADWRERIIRARENAAATLTVVNLLASGLVGNQRNYFDTVPPALEESLGEHYSAFVKEYKKVAKELRAVREADEIERKKIEEDERARVEAEEKAEMDAAERRKSGVKRTKAPAGKPAKGEATKSGARSSTPSKTSTVGKTSNASKTSKASTPSRLSNPSKTSKASAPSTLRTPGKASKAGTKMGKLNSVYQMSSPKKSAKLDQLNALYKSNTPKASTPKKASGAKKVEATSKPSKEDKEKSAKEILTKVGLDERTIDAAKTEDVHDMSIASVEQQVKDEIDRRDGLELTDHRIKDSLSKLEMWLHRANQLEDLEKAAERDSVLEIPHVISHKVWLTNPANKPDVLRFTSEAKSNGKFGKTGMLIFAGDYGPKRKDGTRQVLYNMDPYELMMECQNEQREREWAEKKKKMEEARKLKAEEAKKLAAESATDSIESTDVDDSEDEAAPAPSTAPIATHVEGLCVGSRMMYQLVSDVAAHCGPKALETLKVVMVVSDATESIVVKDFKANEFYGLQRKHVVFLNQHSCPGFRHDDEWRIFKEDPTSKLARYGTGHALEQLTNPGEGFVIGDDRDGSREHLVESTLDWLTSLGVDWILKTHIRLVSKQMFDLEFQAHALELKDRCTANMIFDAVETTLSTSKKWGNIVASRSAKDDLDSTSMFHSRIVGNEALASPEAAKALMKLASKSDRMRTLSATRRWMIETSALQDALSEFRFTPTYFLEYTLEDESNPRRVKYPPAIYPQVYGTDLTLVEKIRAVCVSTAAEDAPADIGQLSIDDPMGTYRHISKVQDSVVGFQSLVKKAAMRAAAKGKDGPNMVMMSTSTAKRHVILVAIADNQSSKTVLDLVSALLLPGLDEVHLVHICKSVESTAKANKMLSQFDVDVVVNLTRHVVHLSQGRTVPELLAAKAEEIKATLMVVASEKLDRSSEQKIGSVAVALCRRMLPCSLLVLKMHSKATSNAAGNKALSFIVGVDANANDTFNWTCDLARRGKDKMILVNCSGTTLTTGVGRRTNSAANIIQIFKDKSVSRGFMPAGREVDGKPSIELPKMQSKMSADFIVVSASKKTGEVSKGVATMLKDPLTSALLIFKPEPEYKTGL